MKNNVADHISCNNYAIIENANIYKWLTASVV
jgi:hypothetical protein